MADTASCRILVVSATTAQAQQFVQHVMASSLPENTASAPALTNASDAGSSSIPWTIANKYYTADVHFETRAYAAFGAHHASAVPAVIYVWGHEDPYKEHVPALAAQLRQHDPEVALAVRFGPTQPLRSQPDEEEEEEEEDGLDAFFSAHGFEYVDGDRAGRRPTRDGGGVSDEDSSGVPGLPRVVDALSTIMWPSLVQAAAVGARRSRAQGLLDWAREADADAEDGMRALVGGGEDDDGEHEEDGDGAAGTSGGKGAHAGVGPAKKTQREIRMQRELEELERWLDEDVVAGAGPRAHADDTGAWGAPTVTLRGPGDAGADADAELGFEDDFAEFVGAPVDVSYAGDRPSDSARHAHQFQHFRLHDEEDEDEGGDDAHLRLRPMHTGASYRTLASGSEYDGDGGDEDEDADADLPTREEIEETSRRIFGAALDVPGPGAGRSPRAGGRSLESHAHGSDGAAAPVPAPTPSATAQPSVSSSVPLSSTAPSTTPSAAPSTTHGAAPDHFDLAFEEEEDEFEFGAFDLSSVLGALQGMKAEIAGMADEGARRRAAARVALGLVYGLQKEEERDGDGDREEAS